jgi:N-acetylglucosaminyldiphosphoundecaprenol N-acetyl-beta-D-mannosaminyltransferase
MHSAVEIYPSAVQRVRLLGGEVDLAAPRDVLRAMDGAALRTGTTLIASHSVHSLCLLRRSPQLRAFFAEADLIEIDSAPLIAWGRLMELPLRATMRSAYLEWRDDFWKLAEARRWRVFYLGGAPGVAETAARRLGERHPRAAIATHHGSFDPAPDSADNKAVLDRIRAFDPDVLMVGMGAPRWTGRLAALIELSALVGPALSDVGAALGRRATLARGHTLARNSAR